MTLNDIFRDYHLRNGNKNHGMSYVDYFLFNWFHGAFCVAALLELIPVPSPCQANEIHSFKLTEITYWEGVYLVALYQHDLTVIQRG